MKHICDMCNGIGYVKEASNSMDYPYVKKCPKCEGGGYEILRNCVEQEQTNEEWFCGLSTETKARITHLVYMAGYRDGFNEAEAISLQDIENWFKQPHTNEELTSK